MCCLGRKIYINLLLFFISFFMLFINLSAVQVSGVQAGVWGAVNNPYQVVGDIEIPANDSLIIEPGVMVNFMGNYTIDAYGNMLAEGTETDSIYFYAENSSWNKIRLDNEAQNIFSFCHFSNAAIPLQSINTTLEVNKCCFDDNEYGIKLFGVNIDSLQAVTITNSRITNCLKNGILSTEQYNVEIRNNNISQCAQDETPRGAIQFSHQSQNEPEQTAYITDNYIHDNVWQGITAYDITGQGNISLHIENNQISNNYTGIYCLYAEGFIRNNEITNNYQAGNSNSGAGIMLYGSSCDFTTNQNTITGNLVGVYLVEDARIQLGNLENDYEGDDGNNIINNNIDETGTYYSVYNATDNTIYAQNNSWDSTDFAEIAATIIDENDNSAYGEVIFEPIANTFSDNGIIAKSDIITIYPNPYFLAGDRQNMNLILKLLTGKNHVTAVKIYNLKGQMVKNLSISKYSTEISLFSPQEAEDLTAGIYFAAVTLNNNRIVKKLTVLK